MRTISSIILALLIGFSSNTFAATGISGDGQINQCEQKGYSITLTNNTGNEVTDIEVTNDLSLLTGFSYVPGTSTINACGVTNGDPTSGTTYDLNTLCGGTFTLADGESVTIEYDLETDCTATSGSNQAQVSYTMLGTTQSESAQLSIEVLPGAITIKKEPAVLSAAIGDSVSWNLIIENSGLGTIKNVVVTDVLGAGLTYDSSSPAGTNAGQTTTWDAAQEPALASMDPGDTVTIAINATVSACDDLDNTADARFGCDSTNSCFNTATDGGTANASIQRLVKTPLLAFTPPDISFAYCGDANPDPVSIVITNNGDGDATNVKTTVDLTPLTVSNVSAGASYDSSQNTFTLDPGTTIPPSGSYTLTFNLEQPNWCSPTLPSSPLLWQKEYEDECGNEFYPPVEVSNITGPADAPSLSATKTGPEVIQIGETATYTINVTHSGLTSCNGSSSTDVTVTDTIPAGFTVDSASSNSNYNGGQGLWTPGADGTGGTYSWLFDPATITSFDATLTLQSPGIDACETVCNTTFDNTVTATMTDCCGCDLSSSASQTTAVECTAAGITSDKTVVPAVSQRCDELTYTNTYTFDATITGIALNELELTEQAEQNQTYKNGTLQIQLNGIPQSCGTAIQGAAGDPVVISLSDCPATPVAETTLEIIYTLDFTEDETGGRCSDLSFYSWSDLDLGPNNAGGSCLADGTIHETVPINIEAPAMSLSINGLGSTINICEEKSVTLTLEQTSTTADPRDVHLVLSGLNYYVIDPTATTCTGVAPDQCAPTVDNGDYHWHFADGFTANGQQAVITLDVQKRCTGAPELTATLYFDDQCDDDDTSDNNCSISASDSPVLLTSGDLLITKTPEVYRAAEDQVEWTIYVTNRGDGTAYNVWIDDILGSGLALSTGTTSISPNNGVTITENQDHEGNVINGVTIAVDEMAPGEKREITIIADLTACTGLTNVVNASWGCLTDGCPEPVTDNSTVQIPTPNLVYTGAIGTDALAPCSTSEGRITGRNSGQTTIYHLDFTQSLPTGMTYVSGSTEWRRNSGSWSGPDPAYDPATASGSLQWTETQIPELASLASGDIIEIRYQIQTNCTWDGGNATLNANYENPCGATFTGGDRTFALSPNEIDIAVVKRRTAPVDDQPLDCSQNVTWEIDVTNNSGFTVQVIRVTDTVGDGFENIASSDGNVSGSQIDWEIGPLAAGATTTLHVSATTDSIPCNTDLDNTVSIQWGCASSGVDNDPATNDYDCLNTEQTRDTHSSTREPSAALANLTFAPASIDACNDSTTMTLSFENSGPTEASNLDLVLDLPAGISYLPGTAQFGIGTDAASAAVSSIADPAISGATLTFTDTGSTTDNLANSLEAAGGNDTAVLQFDVASSCYIGGNVSGDLYFYDCCGGTQYSSSFSQALPSNEPVLTVTKTPAAGQIDCNATKEWTITVTNTGSGNAEVVRIEDTPGAWLEVIPGTASDNVTDMGGGRYGWEFNNLAAGSSVTRTLTTRLSPGASPSDCTASLRQNTAQVFWGCGTTGEATDGDPRTTSYACEDSTPVSVTAAALPMPDLQVTDITPNVTCDTSGDGSFTGSITVRVENTGDGATLSGFDVTVTDGTNTFSGSSGEALASGASVDITVNTTSWNPDCNDCNPYSFTATVDSGNTVCECNDTNNTRTETYIVPIAKLAVTAITPDLSCNGESFVDVTIENQGCAAVDSGIDIAISGDLSGTGSTSSNIAAGGSETVRISLGTPACDTTYEITATVDPADSICECNGDNHSQTATLTHPCCSIDLEKATNGVDADTQAEGPYIADGDTVTWTYVITNTGNTALNNITLSDDQLPAGTISCPSDSLAIGASLTCTYATTVSAALGNQYANNATVTGTPVDSSGNPIGDDLTDSDPSHFYRYAPAITIEKTTNGEDADTPTGPSVPTGSSISWTYTVTNTGNLPLTDITVTDSIEGVISCPAATLAVGATMTCTANGTATAGQYRNDATVTGTSPTGDTVSDSDPSHYFGETGGIDIEKSTNGVDADEPPGPYIPSGDPVNWNYRVTNSGNIVLTNIAVVDDQGVSVSCPTDTLDPGESMDCTGSGVSSVLQYSNNATVTGDTLFGIEVSDSDPSHYYSAVPSIALEKATNGEDADYPQGPQLNEGDSVSWSYVVTNDGEVLINNIMVTDDQGVSVSCPRTSLDAGERMTCTGTGTAVVGQYRNNATVTGDPIAGPKVTDSDPSHYFVEKPEPPPGKPKPPQTLRDQPEKQELSSGSSPLLPARTTDNDDCCLTARKELVAHWQGAEALTVQRDLYYDTHMAMYLAYELADLQRLANQRPRFPQYRLSSQRKRVIALARQASISNVAALTTRSGLGVTMKYADGHENETGLRKKLEALADKAGWKGDISGIEPLLFEYAGAIPIKEEQNGSRWDPAGMDTDLSPLAWGMTILAQSAELERLTAKKTADDRFIRDLLTWQLQQKITMLAAFLRQRSDTERYVPHRFAQPENRTFTLKARDNDYYLVDQAALLLGISRLDITAQTHELPFAKDIGFIRETLWQAMDSRISEESGIWQPYIDSDGSDAETKAPEYRVSDLLFAVLATDMANRAEDSWFASFSYENRIDNTVNFLKKAGNSDGTIGEQIHQDSSTGATSFFATTALARMELIAGETAAAQKRFLAAEQMCNDKRLHLYRPDGLQNGQLSYTPLEIAVFAGFLNEAARQQADLAATVSDRSLAFIERILFQAGLQIEPGRSDSNRRQPIVADDNRDIVPLLVGSRGNLNYKNLPPVAVSRILLNLPFPGGIDKNYQNGLDRPEYQQTGAGNTEPFFRHYKKRTINMEEAALALLYLDDASAILNRLSSWKKNPYLRDNTGLETLSQELTRIWKANLFAISFRYSRGIPLTFSPSLEKRFNLSRDELEERYRQELQADSGANHKGEFTPLFIEYNKGEPFAADKVTGWAGTVPDDTVSTRALTQFERAQIRFLENPGGRNKQENRDRSQSDDVRFINDLITMQLGSKMDFVQRLVRRSTDSGRFLPKTFTVVRDSRKEIIDIEPGAEKSGQLDLVSFALLLADMEQWSTENDQDQASDTRQRQALLDQSISRLLAMMSENRHQEVKKPLLDTALTLDLLAQLANHRQLEEAQRNAVRKEVKAEAERIAGVIRDGDPIKRLAIIGDVENGRNQLAAYGAVITALVRVQTTLDGMDLGEAIKSLAVHFDNRFWNDQLGGYHGQVSSYSSNAFNSKTYRYSELDMSLTITALAATLEFLNEEERPELIGHLVSFGRRLLVFQETSTSVLNRLPQSGKEFDLEIMQDMDIVTTDHKNIYPGDSLRYTIKVYNRCKQGQPNPPLKKVSVRDILPEGVFYLPGTTETDGEKTEDPEFRGNSLYWQLEQLKDHASISFAVQVPPAYRFSELENQLEVRADIGGDRRNRFCNDTDRIADPISRPNSSVDVIYYYDTNLNQRFDSDETKAGGISTSIDGKPLLAPTDHANRFEELAPGWYLLTPDWNSIDSFIVPTRKTPVPILVPANSHKTVHIGLVQYTDVEGFIYDDRNHNGQKEEDEPVLSRARVAVKNRPEYYGYSGKDGYFRIEQIPTDDHSRAPSVIYSDLQPYIENDVNDMTSIGIDIEKP